MQSELNLVNGWSVLQDVHDIAEEVGLYQPDWDPYQMGPHLSVWEPIDRLTHLQLLFAKQPYFGRELRYFNDHAWWYRVEFTMPVDAPKHAILRFEGVDYFAKVWLNGALLGEHEGYIEPFSFDVTKLLRHNGPNVLVVKVSAPWDHALEIHQPENPYITNQRNQIKGTYEHADTFVQRDVNPVGIWRPVKLLFDDGVHAVADPGVKSILSDDLQHVHVSVSWPLVISEGKGTAELRLRIFSERTGREVAHTTLKVPMKLGAITVAASVTLEHPELWTSWDRGTPALYRAHLQLGQDDRVLVSHEVTFGIRSIQFRRTAEETTFLLNGKPIYLRGTSYFPDIYVSKMDRGRYERDMQAAVKAGMNAIRVHVHTENQEFYDVCDRLGLLVFQDFDLNWVFPMEDRAFTERAVACLQALLNYLWNHPSVVCWIPMNEVWPAPKNPFSERMLAEVHQADPAREVILDSGIANDLDSGDSHNYLGSLGPGYYPDIYGTTEKLTTEFGVDAPPAAERARLITEAKYYLEQLLPRLTELHDYAYRLVKYYLEHYRMQKYAPNAGYFQFMWIDLCPQSFYGVYDYWGVPKVEGLGGVLRALRESNQPVGLFLEHKDRPVALWGVNDRLEDLGTCTAEWTVIAGDNVILHAAADISLGPDSRVKVTDLSFPVDPEQIYRVILNLYDSRGKLLIHNVYDDTFRHPIQPEGHPGRIDHELGMRLWWAKRLKMGTVL